MFKRNVTDQHGKKTDDKPKLVSIIILHRMTLERRANRDWVGKGMCEGG